MVSIYDYPNLPAAEQQAIQNGPALTPPDGVTPNYTNPPNRNGEALAVIIVCICLTTLALLGRLYSRAVLIKQLHIEDYLGSIGFLSFIAMAGVYLHILRICGFWVHQWNIRFRDMPEIAKVFSFALPSTYAMALLFAKTAILLEWRRLFSPRRIKPWFWWSSNFLIVANILLYFTGMILSAITCIPHEAIWHPWVNGRCMDRRSLGLATAFFNVFLDVAILILPQRIIWTMKLRGRRRFGISVIFSVGLLTVACAIGRLVATFEADYYGDATYTLSTEMMWMYPETTCAMLVFCMPALPKVFDDQSALYRLAQSIRSWTHLTTSRSSHSSQTNVPPLPEQGNYQKMGGDGQVMSLNVLESQRAIVREPINFGGPIVKQQDWQKGDFSEAGITRTTEVDQQRYLASTIPSSDLNERQHPWV